MTGGNGPAEKARIEEVKASEEGDEKKQPLVPGGEATGWQPERPGDGDDEDNEECCICFKDLATDVLVTACGHSYHG